MMLRWRVWAAFLLSLQSVTANQQPLNTHDKPIEATLSEQWSVLGPFQIGTRGSSTLMDSAHLLLTLR